jgi:hypothetical protein
VAEARAHDRLVPSRFLAVSGEPRFGLPQARSRSSARAPSVEATAVNVVAARRRVEGGTVVSYQQSYIVNTRAAVKKPDRQDRPSARLARVSEQGAGARRMIGVDGIRYWNFEGEVAMTTHSLLFGERSLTTVAALFGQAQDARNAAERIVKDAHLPAQEVKVLGPGDSTLEQKLEPEERGIVHTLIKSHATLGTLGLIVGLLIGGALILGGVGWAVSSPFYTLILAAVFGVLGGMMLGGLVSMRPDRTLLDTKVEAAVQEGRWAVVVHPVNHGEEERALDVLEHSNGEVIHTL